MERRRTTIGMAVDQCNLRASEEWFRQHAGLRSREEAWLNDVAEMETEALLQRGGKLQVVVEIRGRTKQQHHVDVYTYRKQDKLGYVLWEPSKKA
jgi:hypothetical protein